MEAERGDNEEWNTVQWNVTWGALPPFHRDCDYWCISAAKDSILPVWYFFWFLFFPRPAFEMNRIMKWGLDSDFLKAPISQYDLLLERMWINIDIQSEGKWFHRDNVKPAYRPSSCGKLECYFGGRGLCSLNTKYWPYIYLTIFFFSQGSFPLDGRLSYQL